MTLNHLLNTQVSYERVTVILIDLCPRRNNYIFMKFELMLDLMIEEPHFNDFIKHRLLPNCFMYLIKDGYLLLFILIDV